MFGGGADPRRSFRSVFWVLFLLRWEVIGEFRKISDMILSTFKNMMSAE